MKTALLIVAFLASTQAFATSVLQKPLRELVAESDYIVVGTVVRRAMFDSEGHEVKDPDASTGPGTKNELRLFIRIDPSGYLKSTGEKLPEQIVITRFRGHIATLGKDTGPDSSPRIFLLRASPLEEVYPRDSIRDIVERASIEALIQEAQKEPNKRPEPMSVLRTAMAHH